MDVGRVKGAWKNTTIANKIISISAVLASVATLIYAFVAYRQLTVMSAQLGQLEAQTRAAIISSRAAKQAADIAGETLRETKKSWEQSNANTQQSIGQSREAFDATVSISRKDQRAWVHQVPEAPIFSPEIGKPLVFPFAFTNSGKTPARDVVIKARMYPVTTGDYARFSYTSGHPRRTLTAGTVFPGLTMRAPVAAATSSADRVEPIIYTNELDRDFSSGKVWIVFHGQITYIDIFGVHHWTTFCAPFLANFPSGEGSPAGSNPGAKQCAQYNQTGDGFPPSQ